ncbi:interleukin-17 receptor D [Diretmus argenteus]
MWKEELVLYQLLTLGQLLWTQEDLNTTTADAVITPQDCDLECVRQGRTGCEYCRITRADVERTLGFRSIEVFGSCIPWPCAELLGGEDPEVCQHYVQAPNDVTVEFLHDANPMFDTIVVSWKPSYYGIAFLRGFQVSLQVMGGSHVACQLFLFHRNLSLPASHAQRVYKSDPFPRLSLGSQYVVTVMALPVPEEWERFYHTKNFSTRSCAEKNGLDQCKKDWYPRHIEVQQNGSDIIVNFNLAPPNLGIKSYFSYCYANGMKNYTEIRPNPTKNKTHHSFHLHGLQEGTNYTCEIAADEVDAVRKTFSVQVVHFQQEAALPLISRTSLLLMLPLGLSLVAIFIVLLVVLSRKKSKLWLKKLDMSVMHPDMIELHQERSIQEEVMSLLTNRSTPPCLLICYSARDGPAHVRAVMQLGAFLQQHMATQVCLDLWDSLSLAEEGTMGWHCRRIQESDFVLVVCSRGLNHKPVASHPDPEGDDGAEEELGWWSNTFTNAAAIPLIREEVGRARARGQDLSKYMAAIFEYSEETDIPAELGLVSHYTLTRDLPLLFSHLHGVALHRPGGCLKIENISEEGFTKLPAGAALQWAIREAGMVLREKEQQSVEEGD